MAIFHFSMSLVRRCDPSRSKGERAERKSSWAKGGVTKDRSAVGAAAYRAGVLLRDEQDGRVHDYRSRTGVYRSEILLPEGAPAWMQGRAALWNAAELAERRYDARVAREINMAIPVELTPEARVQLVRSFVEREIVSKGLAADVAYHDFTARNPHAHVLMSMRQVTGAGFGGRLRHLDTWGEQSSPERGASTWVAQLREAWCDACNTALAQAGSSARVDHRSLAGQGTGRLPTVHLGPKWTALNREHPETPIAARDARSRANDAVARLNAAREQRWLLVPDTQAAARAATEHYARQLEAWTRAHGRSGRRLDRLLRAGFDPAQSPDAAMRASPAYQRRRREVDVALQAVPRARKRRDDLRARYGPADLLAEHAQRAYQASVAFASEIRRGWARWLSVQRERWRKLMRLRAEALDQGRGLLSDRAELEQRLTAWAKRLMADGSRSRDVARREAAAVRAAPSVRVRAR